MGTSGPYTPSPNWSQAKTNVTNALNAGSVGGQTATGLVGGVAAGLCDQPGEGFGTLPTDFGKLSPADATAKLNALLSAFPPLPAKAKETRGASGQRTVSGGTESRKARGSGGGRGGRRSSGGRSGGGAVRPAAQRLATFLSAVPTVGLRQALRDAGISNADSLPPSKLVLAIADVLSSESSQIIETELRAALVTVLETICDDPDSIESAEELLTTAAYDMPVVVQMLFESYIMERFKTFFCEHEAAKHGYDAADDILKEARQFVSVEMQLLKADRRDLTAVDWAGPEGSKIVDAILERTIAIYTEA